MRFPVTRCGPRSSQWVMFIIRLLMLLAGAPFIAGGMGLTMIGVFAFVGMPMLVVGLGLVSAVVNPRA